MSTLRTEFGQNVLQALKFRLVTKAVYVQITK